MKRFIITFPILGACAHCTGENVSEALENARRMYTGCITENVLATVAAEKGVTVAQLFKNANVTVGVRYER